MPGFYYYAHKTINTQFLETKGLRSHDKMPRLKASPSQGQCQRRGHPQDRGHHQEHHQDQGHRDQHRQDQGQDGRHHQDQGHRQRRGHRQSGEHRQDQGHCQSLGHPQEHHQDQGRHLDKEGHQQEGLAPPFPLVGWSHVPDGEQVPRHMSANHCNNFFFIPVHQGLSQRPSATLF